MVYVSSADAAQYGAWLAAGAGSELEARLPTAAEWGRLAQEDLIGKKLDAGTQLRDLVWFGRDVPHAVFGFSELGIWCSHRTLVSVVGNVAELVKDGETYSARGSSYRTSNPSSVLGWERVVNASEASLFIGFRPVLIAKAADGS